MPAESGGRFVHGKPPGGIETVGSTWRRTVMLTVTVATVTCLVWSLSALAVEPAWGTIIRQETPGDDRGGLKQIIPGHYVYVHPDDAPGISSTFNSGIIVTGEGVVVVDALSSDALATQVRNAIAGITREPIRSLVSSTFHGRFAGGNAVYQDVFKIGHENYRDDLLQLL